MLNAIAGYDPHDSTSSKNKVPDFTEKIGRDIKGMKIAIPKEFYSEGIDDEVRNAVLEAAESYKAFGAELVECSMPSLKYAVAAYYLISSAEASSNLARFDGIKFGHRSDNGGNFAELISNSRSEGFCWETMHFQADTMMNTTEKLCLPSIRYVRNMKISLKNVMSSLPLLHRPLLMQ